MYTIWLVLFAFTLLLFRNEDPEVEVEVEAEAEDIEWVAKSIFADWNLNWRVIYWILQRYDCLSRLYLYVFSTFLFLLPVLKEISSKSLMGTFMDTITENGKLPKGGIMAGCLIFFLSQSGSAFLIRVTRPKREFADETGKRCRLPGGSLSLPSYNFLSFVGNLPLNFEIVKYWN